MAQRKKSGAQPIKTNLGAFLDQYHAQRREKTARREEVKEKQEKKGLFARLFSFGKKEEPSEKQEEKPKFDIARIDEKSIEAQIDEMIAKAAGQAGTRKFFSISKRKLREKADPLTAKGWVMKAILLPKFRYHRFASIFMQFNQSDEDNYAYLFEIFINALTDLYNTGQIDEPDEISLKYMMRKVFGPQHLDALLDAGVKRHQTVINDATTLQDYFMGKTAM